MKNEISKPIKILYILSFAVVAITSMSLFVNYWKGVSPKYPLVVDLHVWAGTVLIFFVILQIIGIKLRNKRINHEKS